MCPTNARRGRITETPELVREISTRESDGLTEP